VVFELMLIKEIELVFTVMKKYIIVWNMVTPLKYKEVILNRVIYLKICILVIYVK